MAEESTLTIDQAADIAASIKEAADWGDLEPMLHLIGSGAGDSPDALVMFQGVHDGAELSQAIRAACDLIGCPGGAVFMSEAKVCQMRIDEGGQVVPDGEMVSLVIVALVHADGTHEERLMPFDSDLRMWIDHPAFSSDDAFQMGGGLLVALVEGVTHGERTVID